MKVITLTFYKKNIRKLLNEINDFWAIEDVDEIVISNIKATYKYILFVTFTICLGAALVVITYCYFGISSNQMILLCYVPERFYLTSNSIIILQLQVIIGSLFILFGFDGLYMFMCYECIVQLKIIKYKIENLAVYEEKDVELNKCIRHHANLIR